MRCPMTVNSELVDSFKRKELNLSGPSLVLALNSRLRFIYFMSFVDFPICNNCPTALMTENYVEGQDS